MLPYLAHEIWIPHLPCSDKSQVHFLFYGYHIAGGSRYDFISLAQTWGSVCQRRGQSFTLPGVNYVYMVTNIPPLFPICYYYY